MPENQMPVDPVRELSRLHGSARKAALESLYHAYNHARYRVGDPVDFVWRHPDPADREVAAWIASALAYGRVASILKALDDLSRRWEHQPAAFLRQASDREMRTALSGFVHRWTRGEHVLGMLAGWRDLTASQDIPARLAAHPHGYRPALAELRTELLACAPEDPGHLFPNPAGPGACKRLAMWLRWMTRKDEIDPGLWAHTLDPSRLWVPLDTHMFRISKRLGLTRRKNPDGEAARRITAAYARIRPEDPLRYDFGITRLGMGQ